MMPTDKIVIGVAGGIGTGKSTVLNIIKNEKNAYIIKADDLGHDIYKKNEAGYKEIVKYFGKVILDKEENIDRNKLGEIVFCDEEKKKWLENLIHPLVIKKIEDEISKKEGIIVLETALMFETKAYELCHKIIGVITDKDIRKDRLKKTRGYTYEKSEQIMEKQISDETLKNKCDFIIYNNKNKEDLLAQINDFFFALYA